jgi:hypothetical protein
VVNPPALAVCTMFMVVADFAGAAPVLAAANGTAMASAKTATPERIVTSLRAFIVDISSAGTLAGFYLRPAASCGRVSGRDFLKTLVLVEADEG